MFEMLLLLNLLVACLLLLTSVCCFKRHKPFEKISTFERKKKKVIENIDVPRYAPGIEPEPLVEKPDTKPEPKIEPS